MIYFDYARDPLKSIASIHMARRAEKARAFSRFQEYEVVGGLNILRSRKKRLRETSCNSDEDTCFANCKQRIRTIQFEFH